MPRISVILPIRNDNPEFLKASVESLLNQTFTDFEIFVIDDGDNEENQELLKSYNDLRIKIIKGDKKGLPAALNKGISFSNSEFIARMDADDMSYPKRFEKQIEFLDNHPEISVLGTSYKEYPSGKKKIFPEKLGYLDFIQRCCIAHPTVMFRKKDFEKYNLKYNESMRVAEDYELWSRAVRYLKFANLKDMLLDYRINPYSLYHSRSVEVADKASLIKDNMLKILTDDENLKMSLYKTIKDNEKQAFVKKIFSIKNERISNKKFKLITFLGFKFRFKVKNI